MTRPAHAVALALMLAGCRAPVGAVTASPTIYAHEYVVDESAGRFALLSPKTTLYADADDRISVWTTHHHRVVAKVLGQAGERVEFELDWPEDDVYPCAPSLGTPGLRVWADLDDLADVVTQPSRVDFGDHSALIIAPGVRVWTDEHGQQTLESRPWFGWGNGDIAVVTDATLPIGKLFAPVRVDSLPVAIDYVNDTSIEFGDGESTRARNLAVFARSPSHPSTVALGNACLIVTGEQVGEGIYMHGDRHTGLLSFPYWVIEPGAALRWPDGRPAGVAYHEHTIFDQPRVVGELRCVIPTEVRGWPLHGLEVCVDEGALREIDRWPDASPTPRESTE